MNEYKPLKLDTPVVPAQGTAFVTNSQGDKKKGKGKTKTKYLNGTEWNALSPEAQSKIIEARKKGKDDDEDQKSVASNKSSKTIKSLSKTMKSLEKDNRRLKKSVSALQKCNRMKTLRYPRWKVQAISKMLWRCLRNIILRLSLP
jgi:predicted RNase H-like nuclease (RuvC/YqgF family)